MAYNDKAYREACSKLETLRKGSPEYERQLDICLDLKWAGCELKEFNPKGL